MLTHFFFDVFNAAPEQTALVYKNHSILYKNLVERFDHYQKFLKNKEIPKGEVVALIGDFTPNCIALLFALIENRNIIVPFDYSQIDKIEDKIQICGASHILTVDDTDRVSSKKRETSFTHPYYETLREINHPGLVLFTSGTSGKPKAAVHDFIKLIEKFKTKRNAYRTVNFLLFDHWGGLNTMFHTLSNGGIVLTLHSRQPEDVCAFIEKHKVELLPASPTFLNLLILSEAYKKYDLSSLKIISYGTEPMPEMTLHKIHALFPNVKLQQTYGLIELGVLRAKSEGNNSLWVKVGGEGYNIRVRNGLLEIKAESAMIGYLNAPTPFTEDGWFMTNDEVEVKGEYLKILGRKSDIINVGGEKVYPAEVENTILGIDFVKDCVVYGVKNVITGKMVFADVVIQDDQDISKARKEIKDYCFRHLARFKVPARVNIVSAIDFSSRFKKSRRHD